MKSEPRRQHQARDPIHIYLTPEPILGEEDAHDEWSRRVKPVDTFLHTQSYKEFLRDDCVYLFGRRGTGKTALMNMAEHEIRRGDIRGYSFAWLIDSEEAYHDLSVQLRLSPLATLPRDDLIHVLKNKWKWVVTISAMIAVADQMKGQRTSSAQLKVIRRYLEEEGLLPEASKTHVAGPPLRHLIRTLTEELGRTGNEVVKAGVAITRVASSLFSAEYEQARAALVEVLASNGKCLVMVDSVEEYVLDDVVSGSVATALIAAAKAFYTDSDSSGIVVKVAFPSELYSHIYHQNRDKVERKTLFILWRYTDLVSVVAKRFRQAVTQDHRKSAYHAFDEFTRARDYLYQFLPKAIASTTGIPFDTLGYIIRHTQKKPRQVILLMNVILTLAKERGLKLSKITEEVIRDGVHARLDMLVKGSVDVFEQVLPNAEQIIRQALTRANGDFSDAELDQYLAEVSGLRKSEAYSRDQVKRMFLEAGVLGVRGESHALPAEGKELVEAFFEYQVKGILSPSARASYMVHPMFYEELEIAVDMDRLTYPQPDEIEEREILASMRAS